MVIINKAGACVALTGVLLIGGAADAASPADKCEATKLKIATKYDSCLLKAQLKAVKNPAAEISGDLAKCDTTFTDKWTKVETKGGGACPTNGDAGSTQSLVTSFTGFLVKRFRPVPFTDNGDGTITDNFTGLMWEKKDGADGMANYADPDDVDNRYTWSNSDILPDGTAFTAFLGSLNNCYLAAAGPAIVGGLGGHCDWRLPTIDELNGVIELGAPGCPANGSGCILFSCPGPCIDTAFGPTNGAYWSSTTNGDFTAAALIGNFINGITRTAIMDYTKTDTLYVRAVRGP